MEAPAEEENTGPSGLGAFFGRSGEASGGDGTGSGTKWDNNAARQWRQTEELAEQDIFCQRACRQGAGADTWEFAHNLSKNLCAHLLPLSHRILQTAASCSLPPSLPPSIATTFYALPRLPVAATSVSGIPAPDLF